MPTRYLPLLALGMLLSSSPLSAQSPDWLNRILSAAQLPVSTAEARVEGTPSDVISTVLDVLIGAKVPAGEAHEVIDEERAARRENGPVDNFGAFVQSQLAAGLRGRELAAAIRAEHAARGKGPKGGAAGERGPKNDAGKSNGHGNAGGRGNADAGARGAQGGTGAHGAAAGNSRGGQPAAHPGHDAHDSTGARSGASAGRGQGGKGKPANHPPHQTH